MKTSTFLLAPILLSFSLYSGSSAAQPKDGFGINAGIASHNMTATLTQGFPVGQQWSYSSSGLSIGIDYQIAASEQFSISPFLMSSGESTSGSIAPNISAGHGILGLQIRYWVGDMFFGGHVGSYSEALIDSTTNTSIGGRGAGMGLVAGWEQRNGGLYLLAQIDSAKVHFTDADVKLGGFRLSVGYRFK